MLFDRRSVEYKLAHKHVFLEENFVLVANAKGLQCDQQWAAVTVLRGARAAKVCALLDEDVEQAVWDFVLERLVALAFAGVSDFADQQSRRRAVLVLRELVRAADRRTLLDQVEGVFPVLFFYREE